MYLLSTAPSFGPKHLIGLFVIMVIYIALSIVLKHKNSGYKKTVLFLLIAFYILEISKLLYLISRDGSYPMNHLPLHLCSLPLYVFPILYFAKENSKLEKYAKAAAFGPVLAAGVIAFLIPGNIIGEPGWLPLSDNFLPIVSFLYHGLMIFASVHLLKSGFYKFELKDMFKAIAFTSCLMILAIIINLTLDRDFMLLNKGIGSPFNFLIDTSQVLYTFTMIILGFIGVSIPFLVTGAIVKIKIWRD